MVSPPVICRGMRHPSYPNTGRPSKRPAFPSSRYWVTTIWISMCALMNNPTVPSAKAWVLPRYSFNRGKAHYIVLDNVFYYSDGYNYMGYITEKQFRWLEQDLRSVKPGALVFVSMHISAYTNEKARNKASCRPSRCCNSQQEIPVQIIETLSGALSHRSYPLQRKHYPR